MEIVSEAAINDERARMGAATPAVDATVSATTTSGSNSSSRPEPQKMHKSAHGEAFYRDVLLQMQSEFARAVAALEKQISCLTEHNELLTEAQQQQQTYVFALWCVIPECGQSDRTCW